MTREEIIHDKAVAAAQTVLAYYLQAYPNMLRDDEPNKQFDSIYRSAYNYFDKRQS